MTMNTHGGRREGSGRKPISDTGKAMKLRSIRMADADWSKFLALGGAAWLRKRLRQAKLPRTGATGTSGAQLLIDIPNLE